MGYRTPNIDRIAKEGASFTDFYAQQSCTAGRASFILGQEPFHTGLLTIGMPGSPHGIPDWTPTLADQLQQHPYFHPSTDHRKQPRAWLDRRHRRRTVDHRLEGSSICEHSLRCAASQGETHWQATDSLPRQPRIQRLKRLGSAALDRPIRPDDLGSEQVISKEGREALWPTSNPPISASNYTKV